MKKLTGKTGKVLEHLRKNDGITSMEAFECYGATRLSAIIFSLRKMGFVIESETKECRDRFGTMCRFSKYKLVGEPISKELVK